MAFLVALPLAALQGFIIFATAWAAMRALKLASPWWKAPMMLLAWLAWSIATVGAYFLLGGDGGLMDGMGMILLLCASAFISAALYAVGWLVWPLLHR